MRDSAAPRSYIEPWSQAWLEATQDKATGRTRAVSAGCVLGNVDFQIDPSSRESGPRMTQAITQRNREARI